MYLVAWCIWEISPYYFEEKKGKNMLYIYECEDLKRVPMSWNQNLGSFEQDLTKNHWPLDHSVDEREI